MRFSLQERRNFDMIDLSISLQLSFDKEVRCLNSRGGLPPIFDEKQNS